MNQTNLDRAVARATGETVERIRRMGFSALPLPRLVPLPKPAPQAAKARPANGCR